MTVVTLTKLLLLAYQTSSNISESSNCSAKLMFPLPVAPVGTSMGTDKSAV